MVEDENTAAGVRRPVPRPLLAEERAALLALLRHADFEGRDALVEQVEQARVTAYCRCGCATVDLEVDCAAPSAHRTYRPIPNEATAVDENGEPLGGVIVFAEDGYLSLLEIYSLGQDPIVQFPPPERLEVFRADRRP